MRLVILPEECFPAFIGERAIDINGEQSVTVLGLFVYIVIYTVYFIACGTYLNGYCAT